MTPRFAHPARAALLGLALTIATLAIGACDETVNPILESDRRFSLYATLDMNRDTQYVRIVPIRESVLTTDAPLDIRVVSTDLDNGLTMEWTDSVVVFSGNLTGHVYHAPLRIEATHRYRLDVLDGLGNVVTTAETTVPPKPRAEVFPEFLRTTPGGWMVTQQLRWMDLPEYPFEVEYWYRFFSYRSGRFENVLMPYIPDHGPASNLADAWDFQMELSSDGVVLDEEHPTWRFDPFAGIGMTITILDEAFDPPGGRFDREVLAQPGTFSNVTGGFGFVGAVGRFSVEWVPTDSSMAAIGFNPLGGVSGRSGSLQVVPHPLPTMLDR